MLVVTAIMVLSLCYILKVLTLCTTNAGGTRTMDIRGRSGGRSVVPFRAHFDMGGVSTSCCRSCATGNRWQWQLCLPSSDSCISGVPGTRSPSLGNTPRVLPWLLVPMFRGQFLARRGSSKWTWQARVYQKWCCHLWVSR